MPSTVYLTFCRCCFPPTVESSSRAKKGDSVTLTCHLSDTSQVTGYEWVRVVYDNNEIQSVGSIQKGKSLRVSNGSEGEWTCRFYGKEGILGNVTHHVLQMSKFFALKGFRII